MAKSYVTQYTEYVSTQQDNLRTKLKNKGLSPSPNATLGSLVSNLDDLQESYSTQKYERDPNFPDIDTMFDNDPLRAVNGGQYLGCDYMIIRIDSNGKIGLPYSSYHYYPDEKIVIGDGTEYDNITSNTIHTVEESGIFYDKYNQPHCLVKCYRMTASGSSGAGYYIPPNTIELIDDYTYNIPPQPAPTTVSGVNSMSNNTSGTVEYWRLVLSNATEDNVSGTTIGNTTSATYTYCVNLKCLRIDGINKISKYYLPYIKQLIINGEYVGTDTLYFGSQYVYSAKISYLKLPGTRNSVSAYIRWGCEEIFITDKISSIDLEGYSSSVYSNFSGNTETIHFGNGISSITISGNYNSKLYNLRNVTCSENAFGINTSAITIDLSLCYFLTRESVLNMFNNFADRTNMTANILRLSTFTKTLVTDEEKLILTNKNWTLA